MLDNILFLIWFVGCFWFGMYIGKYVAKKYFNFNDDDK